MAPPTTPELLLNVQLVADSVPALRIAPPPTPVDWLPTKVQPLTVRSLPASTKTPPNTLVESLRRLIVRPAMVAAAVPVTRKTPVWRSPVTVTELRAGLAVIVTFLETTSGPRTLLSPSVPLRPDWKTIVSLLPNVPVTCPLAGPL